MSGVSGMSGVGDMSGAGMYTCGGEAGQRRGVKAAAQLDSGEASRRRCIKKVKGINPLSARCGGKAVRAVCKVNNTIITLSEVKIHGSKDKTQKNRR